MSNDYIRIQDKAAEIRRLSDGLDETVLALIESPNPIDSALGLLHVTADMISDKAAVLEGLLKDYRGCECKHH